MKTPSQPFVILLAEDEPADAHLIKFALNESGLLTDLHHVVDGREALEFLRQQGPQFADAPRPALILLDLNMPRMDGRECLAAIKKDETLRDIPVVILTTSEVERDIAASYNLGAAGYITKPMDIRQFITIIHQLGEYWIKLVRLPQPI
ncbi:Response regulator Rcp1 [Gammaproteobacteria bacterium]